MGRIANFIDLDEISDINWLECSKEDLNLISRSIVKAIREKNSTKKSVKGISSKFFNITRFMLANYEELASVDKEKVDVILEDMVNYIIADRGGDKVADLDEITFKFGRGDFTTLMAAQTKILMYGNARVPENFSAGYLSRLMEFSNIKNNAIYDAGVINLLEKMGKDYAFSHDETYKDIINNTVIYTLENNPDVANDPQIKNNGQIFNIVFQYAGILCLDNSPESDFELSRVVGLLNNVFEDYMKQLPPEELALIKAKLEKFLAFKSVHLTRDITEYSSFDEFMRENSCMIGVLKQDAVQPYTPAKLGPGDGGKKADNVMSDDDKFKAIQDLILHIRKTNPNFNVGDVLIGEQPPFKGFILFPGSTIKYRLGFDEQMIRAEEDESIRKYGTNLVLAEEFGNSKGSAFYAMTKDNARYVFSIQDPQKPNTNHGPATRTIAKNKRPGLVTVEHVMGYGFNGYEGMVIQAVDDLLANPTINQNYARPFVVGNRKLVAQPQVQRQAQPVTPKNPVTPKKQDKPKIAQDDLERMGIKRSDVEAAPTSNDVPTVKSYIEQEVAKAREKSGGDANKLNSLLIYFCFSEMILQDKSFSEVTDYMAEVSDMDKGQMFNYVKAQVQAVNQIDPKHINGLLKQVYGIGIKKLEAELADVRDSNAAKRKEIDRLNQNLKNVTKIFDEER